MMQGAEPIIGELVLVGGGHAQVAVLKSLAMKPIPGLRTTIICNDLNTPYSGMLPGFVEGIWQAEDITIDLPRLAQMAGARLIHGAVCAIDAAAKQVYLDGRPAIPFDVLSVNIGGVPNPSAISGAAENTIPVKPIGQFRQRLAALTAETYPKRIAVIGGGISGCELALALSARWQKFGGQQPELTLFNRGPRLIPEFSERAAQLIAKALNALGCEIYYGQPVTEVGQKSLTLADGRSYAFDAAFLVTAVSPPSWLRDSGLALDADGFIAVGRTLQSNSHSSVFAAGDVATLTDDPRPKAGVYAVRAGPILTENIRNFLRGRPLRQWKPQSRALAIVGTADGRAIGIRGSHASHSRAWWWLKKRIDRKWMQQYQRLKMPPFAAAEAFAGLAGQKSPESHKDPAFEAMRCFGCGAKTGHGTLQRAMAEAVKSAIALGADPRFMPADDLTEDSAVLPVPDGGALVQSVDIISEIVTDPFQLGQIAVAHALSDIYAANAKPLWALANVTLAMARVDLQQAQLAHLMAGSLLALSKAGVRLVGGHTGESSALNIGFAVTGSRSTPPSVPIGTEPIMLLLSKPLGIGVIMAAHMQLAARSDWLQASVQSMIQSNGDAAAILAPQLPLMTDITGFGLARHALNLAERCGAAGVDIELSQLPVLEGALSLLAAGYRSSLHDQNRASVPLASGTTVTPHGEILFDPQTSGGLLAALPASSAAEVHKALCNAGHEAAIIGKLHPSQPGLSLRH